MNLKHTKQLCFKKKNVKTMFENTLFRINHIYQKRVDFVIQTLYFTDRIKNVVDKK